MHLTGEAQLITHLESIGLLSKGGNLRCRPRESGGVTHNVVVHPQPCFCDEPVKSAERAQKCHGPESEHDTPEKMVTRPRANEIQTQGTHLCERESLRAPPPCLGIHTLAVVMSVRHFVRLATGDNATGDRPRNW